MCAGGSVGHRIELVSCWKLLERCGPMSGSNFIMMVAVILILLFVVMAIGPLFSI